MSKLVDVKPSGKLMVTNTRSSNSLVIDKKSNNVIVKTPTSIYTDAIVKGSPMGPGFFMFITYPADDPNGGVRP